MKNFLNISPVLPVNDIKAEIEFFERLGFKNAYDSLNYTDKLDYAVMNRDGQNVHLQFQFEEDMPSKNAAQQIKIWVTDLDALETEFKENGFAIKRRNNTPWGTHEFGIYSPAHNAIIFVQDLD
jgi:catechol 2,3-dioxygenase-like lactoylglutathione lyase family enzyme